MNRDGLRSSMWLDAVFATGVFALVAIICAIAGWWRLFALHAGLTIVFGLMTYACWRRLQVPDYTAANCQRCGAWITGQCFLWSWRPAIKCRTEGTEHGAAMMEKEPGT